MNALPIIRRATHWQVIANHKYTCGDCPVGFVGDGMYCEHSGTHGRWYSDAFAYANAPAHGNMRAHSVASGAGKPEQEHFINNFVWDWLLFYRFHQVPFKCNQLSQNPGAIYNSLMRCRCALPSPCQVVSTAVHHVHYES